ncbi:HesB/IscA family protein [Methylolobus aquaticus]
MTLTVTESAARQINKQLARRSDAIGLRLGVKKSGCSGFAYVIDYADSVLPEDAVFEQYGVKVVVSQDALPYLDGIEVDYRREGLNEAFRFNNPNVKASCGCGESFTV